MSSLDPGMSGPRPDIPRRPAPSRPRAATQSSSSRSTTLLWIALLVIAAVVATAVYLYTQETPTITTVAEETPQATAEQLHEINGDYDQAEIVSLLEGPGPGPVPGTYEVDVELDTVGVVRQLQANWIAVDPGITFPEGFTVNKMATRIATHRWQYTVDGLVVAADGLTVDPRLQRPPEITSVEGLLFPSTYPVGSDVDASRTMGQMLVMMQTLIFDDLDIVAASQEFGLTPYQLMTIASLIEKEAKTDGDRALISRVIHNRIERNMKLQIDASLYYQAPEEATFSELREADSPYHLYERDGLPPTPIANPGRASIDAALHPAPRLDPGDPRCAEVPADQCALLFYVLAAEDGSHAFSVTNEQHEANIDAAREAGVL